MTSYVSRFRDGDKDQKDLLGGKGANLAEMTNLDLPVPPGFTITTEACRAYMRDGHVPPGAAGRGHARRAGDRGRAGPPAGGLPRAAAGVGALRREVLDARDDGDGPQHRAQRRVGEGADRVLRRRAVRLGLLPPAHPDVRQDGARASTATCSPTALDERKAAVGAATDVDLSAQDLRVLVDTFKEIVVRAVRAASSRSTRASSSTWRSRRSSTRGTPTGRGCTGAASGSRTTSAPRSTS